MKLSELKNAMTKKRKPSYLSMLEPSDFLHTGSTLLNLACTGRVSGGFAKGSLIHNVGDSVSGKSFLSLTCFAEATINKNFDDYRLIFDAAEGGAMMDINRYFGPKLAERIEPPAGTKADPEFSAMLENLFYNLDSAFKKKVPFIYCADSLDVLDCEADLKKFNKKKTAKANDKTESGSYGMARAKILSENLRRLVPQLRKSKSIVILISQAKEKVETFGFGDKKTYAGGRGPKFYADLQLWCTPIKKLTKKVRDKNRNVGIVSRVAIKKNRHTGVESNFVDIPIYNSFGIDNVGACVSYLIEEKHWKKGQGGIRAKELDVKLPEEKLIRHIEKEGLEKELIAAVKSVYTEIQEASQIKRKSRYHV